MATAPIRTGIGALPEPGTWPWHIDEVLIGGTLLTLAFGTLALGAVLPSAIFVLRTCACLLFVLWGAAQIIQGKVLVAPSPVYLPALTFIALVVGQIVFGVSAYKHATLSELLNYIAYGLFAFVMVQATAGRHPGKVLCYAFSGFGLAVAIFALLQYLTSNGEVFWSIRVPADAPFFGSYVNHNHYAGLMELLIGFPLIAALESRLSFANRLFFGFAAMMMGVSVVESGSRGGVIALLCQVALLMVIGRVTKMKKGAALVLMLLLLAMALLLTFVADSGVMARLSSLREPGRADVAGWRMHLNRDSLAMVRARPILGWGLGDFPAVYPQFRSFYDDAPIEQAHNDYLQLLVETGILGGLICLWFLFVVLREGWRNLGRSQGFWERNLTGAAMLSVAGLLVHSASDFNLHIPANAAVFFVMCGLAITPLGRSHADSLPREAHRHASMGRNSSDPMVLTEELQPKLRVVVRRF